jgi:molecular chaperone GrpE (heat shock protein)
VSKQIISTHCIDCRCEFTTDNRSKQQPGIRCQKCFDKFGRKIQDFLEDEIKSPLQIIRDLVEFIESFECVNYETVTNENFCEMMSMIHKKLKSVLRKL